MKALCINQLSIFDEGHLYEYTRATLLGQYVYDPPIKVLAKSTIMAAIKRPAHEFLVTKILSYDSFRLIVSNSIHLIDKLEKVTGLNLTTIMRQPNGYILKAKFEDHEFHAHFRRFL